MQMSDVADVTGAKPDSNASQNYDSLHGQCVPALMMSTVDITQWWNARGGGGGWGQPNVAQNCILKWKNITRRDAKCRLHISAASDYEVWKLWSAAFYCFYSQPTDAMGQYPYW
jgi:hypothetical protein